MDQLEHIWLLIHFYITCDHDKFCHLQSPAFLFFFFRGRRTHRYTVITGCFPFSIMIAALPLVDFSTFFIDIGYISNWEKDESPERSSENVRFLLLIVLLSFVLPHSCLVLQTSTTQFPVISISNYFTIFTKNKKNYPDICEKIFVKHRLHLHYCEKGPPKPVSGELVILHEILI